MEPKRGMEAKKLSAAIRGLSSLQPHSLSHYPRRVSVGLQPPRRIRRARRDSVLAAVGFWECNLLHTGFDPADTGGMPQGPSAVLFARLVISPSGNRRRESTAFPA